MKQITFDEDENRPILDGNGIHCGDYLEILTEDGYKGTCVEYNTDWYFTKFPNLKVVGMIARWKAEE